MISFRSGVNLGGWLSQYRAYDHRHFQSFITTADIQRIAAWGMDHVRLPVDYPVFESDDHPFEYHENGFEYVDNCLEWCRANGLKVILDLHRAPGYSFSTLEVNTLFSDPDMQERFLCLWDTLTRRYRSEGDYLAFELLNEVVLPSSDLWNQLVHKAVARIHQADMERLILVGPNQYNSVHQLSTLAILDDQRILYTFHFYEPFIFTHQLAQWVPYMVEYGQQTDYPGEAKGLGEFLVHNPTRKTELGRFLGVRLNKDLLRTELKPAVEFMQKYQRPLYCGEFGAIDCAPIQSRINWHRDLISVLEEYGIGGACWSYKGMDFGLVNRKGEIISEELVKIVKR